MLGEAVEEVLVLEDEVGFPAITVAGLAAEVEVDKLDDDEEPVLGERHALEPTPAVGVFVCLPGMINVWLSSSLSQSRPGFAVLRSLK